ncbi:unnamed protein product [Sphagnum jensenii]
MKCYIHVTTTPTSDITCLRPAEGEAVTHYLQHLLDVPMMVISKSTASELAQLSGGVTLQNLTVVSCRLVRGDHSTPNANPERLQVDTRTADQGDPCHGTLGGGLHRQRPFVRTGYFLLDASVPSRRSTFCLKSLS